MTTLICTGCSNTHTRKGQRYCSSCHAAAQRRYRSKLKRERIAMARIIHRAVSVSPVEAVRRAA